MATLPSTCSVSGYLISLDGTVLPNVTIVIEPLSVKQITDYVVFNNKIEITTDETGYFVKSLVRSTDDIEVYYRFTFKYGESYNVLVKKIPNVSAINFNLLLS